MGVNEYESGDHLPTSADGVERAGPVSPDPTVPSVPEPLVAPESPAPEMPSDYPRGWVALPSAPPRTAAGMPPAAPTPPASAAPTPDNATWSASGWGTPPPASAAPSAPPSWSQDVTAPQATVPPSAPGWGAPPTTPTGGTVPPYTPGWGAPPASPPSGPRRSGGLGAAALLAAVVIIVASVAGYAVGRINHTHSLSSNGSASSQFPGFFGNGANNNGGSSNGNNSNGNNGSNGNSPFGGGFGQFGPSTGNGSNGSNGFGSGGSSNFGSSGSSTPSATAQKVAQQIDPAIVDVTSTLPNGEAEGTGMVITSDGEILTNDHVISGATSIKVQFVTTGKSYSASLVGYDASQDVALLKISNGSGLATISTNTSNVNTGQNIVVVGNAYGQNGTPTVVDGTVAATNQTITASDEQGFDAETLNGLVELSADVVPGDSGGAVADTDGHVIAMTTAAYSGNASPVSNNNTTGDAYAIPIDHALSVVHQLENGQASSTVHLGEHGVLGVAVQNGNGGGAQVAQVESGSAAAAAGLSSGDTITGVNGTNITSANDLNSAMAATHVGDHITVQWQDSNGSSHQGSATLTNGVA